MSKTRSDNSANSTANTTVPNWEKLPCVQYGFPEGKGPIRTPKLRTIFEPIPKDATTVSPVYGLKQDQYERQQRLESGYEVSGDVTSIATELQNECEADDRVLYPIHIESDVYHEEGPATLIEWFREFVEEYLEVPFHTCTLYFSGNRSIHVHVPRFVSGEEQREQLKELAKTYCDDTGSELDCGLYSSKRLFRLPGVKHEKTGLRKVEIEPEWGRDQIFCEANTALSQVPGTYEEILREIFVRDSLTVEPVKPTVYIPHDLFRILDSDKTKLEFSSDNREPPLTELTDPPVDTSTSEMKRWSKYNAKEFSPYALASGNGRSVAALKVKGTPFARQNVTVGNCNRPAYALVPAYFYGAQGCAGEEFTKTDEHAPLQLSKRDYQKWDYEVGDHVVIIGGKSRNSRIISVDSWTATVVGHALTGDDASREAALDYLETEGHDTGKQESSIPNRESRSTGRSERTTAKPEQVLQTEADALQQQAEKEGIETLSHKERFRVACRLLRFGWEPAWEWFKQQYGDGFKPNVTRNQLLGVIKAYPEDYTAYPEDYTHVDPPRS